MLADPGPFVEQVDAATLAGPDDPVAADPVLAAGVRRTNRANLLRWVDSNVHNPGEPVEPYGGPEVLDLSRDLVRRGLDARALASYRIGQNAAWQLWMARAFDLTSDPEELREMLDVSARSIFAFVDATLEMIWEQIEAERDQLTRGTHAERLEAASLILEGAQIGADRASARLGYELGREHTAAIVWSDAADADPAELERAADALGRAASARPLTITAAASALWVWVAGEGPDLEALEQGLDEIPGVRIALGPRAAGMRGFRRSHFDAIATQRLMHRSQAVRIAGYEEVQVAALATENEERATEFVQRALGELAGAPPELRETARVYLREGSSASRAARALFTHRNTIAGRLRRIDELLPEPLAGRGLQVGLALEIQRWTGEPA